MDPVIQRSNSERIAGAKEPATAAVPYREREVTDDPRGTTVGPESVGLQHELGVGVSAQAGAFIAQPSGELGTVVDPAVEGETESPAFVEQRLLFAQRLRRRTRDAMPEAHGAVGPVTLAVRTAMSDRGGQLPQKLGVDRTTMEAEDARETAHGARSCGALVTELGGRPGMRASTA